MAFFELRKIIQACTLYSWVFSNKSPLSWMTILNRLRWNRWRTRKRTWTRKHQQKFSSQSLFLLVGSRLSSLLTRLDLAMIWKGCAVCSKSTACKIWEASSWPDQHRVAYDKIHNSCNFFRLKCPGHHLRGRAMPTSWDIRSSSGRIFQWKTFKVHKHFRPIGNFKHQCTMCSL